MRKIIFAMSMVLIFGIAVLAEATLIDRGGGLIYCDTLDITWLQDASYAKTTGYDADGEMTWDNAVSWADSLSYYDSVRGVTWDDWRLPTTVDGTLVYGYKGDPDGDGVYSYTYGFNLANSEMGHLFYTELGNKGYRATDGTMPQPGWGLLETGDFINLQPDNYWSGTEYAANPDNAWNFNFNNGNQNVNNKNNNNLAWAVRPGE